jgi:hypothetical protein
VLYLSQAASQQGHGSGAHKVCGSVSVAILDLSAALLMIRKMQKQPVCHHHMNGKKHDIYTKWDAIQPFLFFEKRKFSQNLCFYLIRSSEI